jgi:hypothetical protein
MDQAEPTRTVDSPPTPESAHGKALAALGSSKGGRARASVLTPEQRSQIAREAVRARWLKAGKLKEIAAEEPKPADSGPAEKQERKRPFSMFRGTLALGPQEYECHVLNDGRRVFTQREIVRALSGGRESGNLQRYLDRNPLTAKDFKLEQFEFDVPGAPQVAVGYEATQLIELCDRYMQAAEDDLLKPSQMKLVAQSAIIIRACAKVGIIALIDEATGYQEARAKNSLRLKLQAFIADDLQEWALMFPEEFWLELARLEGVHYSPRSRPLRWGKYIMAFVYDAVDKDVGRELRKKNPNPHYLKNHHQWLKEFGREKVNNQIQRVIAIMKLCTNMDDFRSKFAHVFKKTPLQTTFDDLDWNLSPIPA